MFAANIIKIGVSCHVVNMRIYVCWKQMMVYIFVYVLKTIYIVNFFFLEKYKFKTPLFDQPKKCNNLPTDIHSIGPPCAQDALRHLNCHLSSPTDHIYVDLRRHDMRACNHWAAHQPPSYLRVSAFTLCSYVRG